MTLEKFKNILAIGETVAVEFKRCGNKIESDVYESVCSFLNRFGGDLFLGVLDDGTVTGVNEKDVPYMVKNFISVVSDPNLFSPTAYLSPEIMKDDEGHTIIHVHIPPSAEVHSYKKVVYDRVNDSDVKVRATGQIAQMYIRKQDIFTERKIFPYATIEDFRFDLLPRVRQMAVNNAAGEHPWKNMGDEELLKSAGFYGTDKATGQSGYNLAGLMLLGKDDVIQNVCPAYITDALLRKVNVDRYDDREIVQTNLIESYDALMAFARKHLPDKFFLEDDKRVSLRNIIAREIISNVLMHREFTSSYMARFVIEKNRMYVENANRALGADCITPENLAPHPKNPIIASFFRTIGLADGLGSGTRKLFHYTKFYSGKDPELKEGDIFRITVPLDDDYSYEVEIEKQLQGKVGTGNGQKLHQELHQGLHQELHQEMNESECVTFEFVKKHPSFTGAEISKELGISLRTVKNHLAKFKALKMIVYVGSKTKGYWQLIGNKKDSKLHQELHQELHQALHQELNESERITFEFVKKHPSFTGTEISKALGISLRTVKNHLAKFKALKMIVYVGSKTNGHWEVIISQEPSDDKKGM